MKATTLPSRLAQARRARGLTQSALAAKSGVPHLMMVSGWERGRNAPRIDYLVSVAGVLDVSLDWLVGRTNQGGPGEGPAARRKRAA